MLIALERTNLGLYPRVFTISQGNPSSINGAADMGGSGQFTWDLTFTANILSLLDPAATKEVLRFIIASTNLALPFPGWEEPWLVPQTWCACFLAFSPSPSFLSSLRCVLELIWHFKPCVTEIYIHIRCAHGRLYPHAPVHQLCHRFLITVSVIDCSAFPRYGRYGCVAI